MSEEFWEANPWLSWREVLRVYVSLDGEVIVRFTPPKKTVVLTPNPAEGTEPVPVLGDEDE